MIKGPLGEAAVPSAVSPQPPSVDSVLRTSPPNRALDQLNAGKIRLAEASPDAGASAATTVVLPANIPAPVVRTDSTRLAQEAPIVTGRYVDPIYKGSIEGYMVVRNMDRVIGLLTGSDTALFDELPKIGQARFSNGVLRYVFDPKEALDFKFGYSVKANVERKSDGVVIISYVNANPQLTQNPQNEDENLVNFLTNSGTWTFTPIKDSQPPCYRVVWKLHTVTDKNTLPTMMQFGSFFLPDSVITNQTRIDTLANFKKIAEIAARE